MNNTNTQLQRAFSTEIEISYGGKNLLLSIDDCVKWINPKMSMEEAAIFLAQCRAYRANPLKKEIYSISYRNKEGKYTATTILGKGYYLTIANQQPNFKGYRAGIIVEDKDGEEQYKEGEFLGRTHKLVGGWAEIFIKDREPFKHTVSLDECMKLDGNGRPTDFWTRMPAAMIRKTAIIRALRECFPELQQFAEEENDDQVELIVPGKNEPPMTVKSIQDVSRQVFNEEITEAEAEKIIEFGSRKPALQEPAEPQKEEKEQREKTEALAPESTPEPPKPTEEEMPTKADWVNFKSLFMSLGLSREEIANIGKEIIGKPIVQATKKELNFLTKEMYKHNKKDKKEVKS